MCIEFSQRFSDVFEAPTSSGMKPGQRAGQSFFRTCSRKRARKRGEAAHHHVQPREAAICGVSLHYTTWGEGRFMEALEAHGGTCTFARRKSTEHTGDSILHYAHKIKTECQEFRTRASLNSRSAFRSTAEADLDKHEVELVQIHSLFGVVSIGSHADDNIGEELPYALLLVFW
jgi:hypothetical protein